MAREGKRQLTTHNKQATDDKRQLMCRTQLTKARCVRDITVTVTVTELHSSTTFSEESCSVGLSEKMGSTPELGKRSLCSGHSSERAPP